MRCIGKIAQLGDRGELLLPVEKKIEPGTTVCVARGRKVGRISDLFGPVSEPWVVVRAARGVRATQLLGRELFCQ